MLFFVYVFQNEEPLDCQRLFTVLGSAYYHSGYLIYSHFIHNDLIDVHLYCSQQGLFHVSKIEPVKSLVHWREVYPSSCSKNLNSKLMYGRRYLLVVGSGKVMTIDDVVNYHTLVLDSGFVGCYNGSWWMH